MATVKVDGALGWVFVVALSSCATSGPVSKDREKELRSGAPEPSPVVQFELDVRGEKIGLVGGGAGPLCEGEVQGVVLVHLRELGTERPISSVRITATQVSMYWYVQWDAATPGSVECAEIDALEGDVIPRGGQCPADPP